MAKFVEIFNDPGRYTFECPGCGFNHFVNTNGNNGAPVWEFDKDLVKPTVSPSILVTYPYGENQEQRVCHSFIKKGHIQFLNDCTHALKGQTVELPDIDS